MVDGYEKDFQKKFYPNQEYLKIPAPLAGPSDILTDSEIKGMVDSPSITNGKEKLKL